MNILVDISVHILYVCTNMYSTYMYMYVHTCAGNKEDEEAMMQEWFSLLNGKNELIKRQIELNLV